MLWQVDILPRAGEVDRKGLALAHQAADLGLGGNVQIAAAHGFLLQGLQSQAQAEQIARELLVDSVVEQARVAPPRDPSLLASPRPECTRLVHVLPRPGAMDPVAQSATGAIADMGLQVDALRTLRKYWIGGVEDQQFSLLCNKLLANEAIEQIVVGPLLWDRIELGSPYAFKLVRVPIRELSDEALLQLSRQGQLYLSLAEMQTIQAHFRSLDRDPTDIELETVAQTWSEHCSHKTLAGRVQYQGPEGSRQFNSMLKETIFAATQKIRQDLGDDDWCVSVFKDNAGIVRFDERYHVCFKVETHNHPSALEPYGGANTGLGGVIRDPLGTGMGAKPICNTNVFCFAPPTVAAEDIPTGALHPRRVMQGVVSGVRDYGNRMGIPTVNGALYFDQRYLGNPLVYCGNVGLLPRDCAFKQPLAGDYIVAIGGRTGRDGIHGATFSSAELTHESETLSGGAVQIGNAITEKMLLDVVLAARDQKLYHAITDCGAGGFSSAVGEMGEEIGAEVWLDQAPLKYDGLSYTEIWISEAQERMVLSVGPNQWERFRDLCASEGVEATIIGKFVPTGKLTLKYGEQEVGELTMHFLHEGRPPIIRQATYEPPAVQPLVVPPAVDANEILKQILGSLNVASKHWVIRQYDHEVQGNSVVKPLVGVANDGPSDAAVIRPYLETQRGLAIACGMNPYFGDFDTYHMAASAIDEALRNCVAVGADPAQIAILDNFCWANTDRPETLGSLVRAALACYDLACVLQTPFVSGKDSLNNEFRYQTPDGKSRSIAIPPSLLISAMGQVENVSQCVTMDLKRPGNFLYLIGETRDELGGSHFAVVQGLAGGAVPQVQPALAKRIFTQLHQCIRAGLVRSCHDLSEGGIAVAAAEMAFAGGFGAELDLGRCKGSQELSDLQLLFSESNTRFLCEVDPTVAATFEMLWKDLPLARIGQVTEQGQLRIVDRQKNAIISEAIGTLKQAWQQPLDW